MMQRFGSQQNSVGVLCRWCTVKKFRLFTSICNQKFELDFAVLNGENLKNPLSGISLSDFLDFSAAFSHIGHYHPEYIF
jgi:hypothetical protein